MARRSNVQVTGDRALIANLHAFSRRTRERFRVVTRDHAQRTRDRAVQVAPKETGYMARKIRYELSPDEIVFDVFCDPADFLPHDLEFYPFFVHEGTSRMPPRPFLRDAYDWDAPQYQADIRAAVKYAMSRGGR